ncbi:CAP domain-containing protein [Paenibacillus segetis]|uniref:SCP domain-containing protein n=1 Tax=Paenibacillus segetis TaxID=1325360 RepID=A0ABQ1YFX8_9BACL|nr:CAP domain-containing protein [Paenibacillus segetis]GGH23849.1 hypothetical protein GCM10008013_23260 [Paenibacillus segetis]
MKKRTTKRVVTSLLFSIMVTSLAVAPVLPSVGGGTAYAATTKQTKQLAAVYARIQKEHAAEVVQLVNEERVNAGLKPLVIHTNLSTMAKDKAIDMFKSNYFSHTSPKYGSPFDMMDAYNITYRYAGENIAMGQKSAEEVVKAWMNSPGHKANILNENYGLIGVGYYNGYWVQEFVGK